MTNELNKIGFVISRHDGASWRDTVIRYATIKNLVGECLYVYDQLVDEGLDESFAALRALECHACADIITSDGLEVLKSHVYH